MDKQIIITAKVTKTVLNKNNMFSFKKRNKQTEELK